MKVGELFGTEPPTNFRMPRERARARARDVEKNSFEIRSKGKRLGGIELNQMCATQTEPLQLCLHGPQPMGMQVCGDDASLASRGPHESRGFSSRGGAYIDAAGL